MRKRRKSLYHWFFFKKNINFLTFAKRRHALVAPSPAPYGRFFLGVPPPGAGPAGIAKTAAGERRDVAHANHRRYHRQRGRRRVQGEKQVGKWTSLQQQI